MTDQLIACQLIGVAPPPQNWTDERKLTEIGAVVTLDQLTPSQLTDQLIGIATGTVGKKTLKNKQQQKAS
jgi:hypothetical protein